MSLSCKVAFHDTAIFLRKNFLIRFSFAQIFRVLIKSNIIDYRIRVCFYKEEKLAID